MIVISDVEERNNEWKTDCFLKDWKKGIPINY